MLPDISIDTSTPFDAEVSTQFTRRSVPISRDYAVTRVTVEVVGDLVTSKRRGIRSASSRMWVTMATMRPDAPSSSIAAAVTSRVSGSSVPNPSSRNSESNPGAPSGAKSA